MVYSFGRTNWFPWSGGEHRACRERVALFDQSSFAKFLVQGRDAERVMQRLCSNDMGVEAGRVVYTAMLNSKAGIETDCTVTRLSDAPGPAGVGVARFFVVTSTAQGTRDADWITRNFAAGENVTLTDVTSAYAVLSVMGPRARYGRASAAALLFPGLMLCFCACRQRAAEPRVVRRPFQLGLPLRHRQGHW